MTSPARLPHRSVLAITGKDAASFLERLVTCRIDDMAAPQTRFGALLTPQGKIICDFLIQRTDDGFLLDCPAPGIDALQKRLTMFKLRAAVDITRPDGMAVLIDADGFADPRSGAMPRRAFGASEHDADLGAYHATRIAAGIPELGEDFGGSDVFPADVNMDRLHGVDFKKGCFVGQEVVSRMYRRGKTRKRTLTLHGTALEPGLDVRGATPVGTITSVAGPAALALIRIDRMAAADALTVNDNPVSIEKPDWLQGEIDALLNDG